jgi:hypothetical protein
VSRTTHVEIETLRYGQERAYGPSVIELGVKLWVTDPNWDDGKTHPYRSTQINVLSLVRIFVRDEFRFHGDGGGPISWSDFQLDSVAEVSPGFWNVRIEQPYLD